MSYCQREDSGKDKSVFLTQEDAVNQDLVTELVEEDSYGVILPSGEINWDCPCLGDLPRGTCGEQFKTAFSCFHYSEEEEKGSDCIPQFRAMQDCFLEHPEEYGKYDDQEEEDPGSEEGRGGDSVTTTNPDSASEETSSSSNTSSDTSQSDSSRSIDSGSETQNQSQNK